MKKTTLKTAYPLEKPSQRIKNDGKTICCGEPWMSPIQDWGLALVCSLLGILTVQPLFSQGKEQISAGNPFPSTTMDSILGGPKVTSVKPIARLTGATVKGDTLPNPNAGGKRYNVGGTDLGIFWEMADGTIGCFFGDTNGNDFKPSKIGGGNGGAWRSNVLAFSKDKNLEDGLSFSSWAVDSKGSAREIIPSAHDTSGKGDWTSIPTAAISVLGTEYVHYMNVRDWGAAGN